MTESGSWRRLRVKDVATWNDDVLSDSTPSDHSFRYIDIGAVTQGKVEVPNEPISFGSAPSRARRLARDGDVIISTVRTYLKAIAPVPGSPESLVFSTGFAVLRPFAVEPKFLGWLVQSDEFTSRVEAASVGVSYPAVNASDIAAMAIEIPNDSAQRAIADYLDRETAQIDTLIAKQEQLIATLRERRTATIDRLTMTGLNPSATMSSHGFLGELPAAWKVVRFGRAITISGGQVDPQQPEWQDVVLVAPNHIESGTARIVGRETAAEQGAESGKYVVRAGQILYSKIRPALNKVAIAPEDGLCSADMYALSATNEFDHRYLLYYLISQPFLRYATMTSMRVKMPKINREELAQAVVPMPPLNEQRKIAESITTAVAKIDTLIAKAERFIELSKERRAALITAAVTGQLEIPGT